jgi:hypothetical protein
MKVNSIRSLFCDCAIYVPNYQRAYSWDTPKEGFHGKTQTDVFLNDLEKYVDTGNDAKYFFGHFLLQKKTDEKFAIIDGQQRLTTIVIFLSCVRERLKSLRELADDEETLFEDIIKRKNFYKFETVSYDGQFFKDYIIDRKIIDQNSLETQSAKRAATAYDYFTDKLSVKSEKALCGLLDVVANAFCTVYFVENESEAARMFIFQNDRGKKPTDLEILKARFIAHIYMYADQAMREGTLKEINERFERIYKSVSKLEGCIDENDLLRHTSQIYYNSLWQGDALKKADKELEKKKDSIDFITNFVFELEQNFLVLEKFFLKERHVQIHSFIVLDSYSMAIPFITKSYRFNLPSEDVCALVSAFESISLRQSVIGTRADITSRINDVFERFTMEHKEIKPIMDRINQLKIDVNWWWSYWNSTNFEAALRENLKKHKIACFILWQYENFLRKEGGRRVMVLCVTIVLKHRLLNI